MDKQKKQIRIIGSFMQPVKVGEPAYICEYGGGYRQTSVVEKYERISKSECVIETRNSLYSMHLVSSQSLTNSRMADESFWCSY